MSTYKLINGDCIEEMKKMDANSIDSIVTDPPYGLVSITKRFGKKNSAKIKKDTTGAYKRLAKGFMGKEWDGSGIEYNVDMWKEALRVLKPGGHMLAFSSTRTYHRMVCAIEDSGFEIRDQLAWIYGSGFPKSQNVGKMIDKKKGKAEDAKKYQGYGTALKPAQEIIVLAQKALTPLGNCSNIINNLNEYIILCKQNVKPVANLSLHSQVVSNEVKISSVQENAEIQVEEEVKNKMETGKAEDLQEAMDISQYSKKEVNIVLNTMLLWKSILEEVCEEMKKSTTSMKYETIIDWKTFSLLLKQITPNSIIKVKTNQNGQSAAAYTAANYCSDQVKLLKNILTHSATANVIEMEVGKHLEETGIHPNLTPIVLARKPLSEKTVAANVIKHGTGAINIDDSRVGNEEIKINVLEEWTGFGQKKNPEYNQKISKGRWPANIIHDGSEEVMELFPDNSGSAARFFYCAKANKHDRDEGCEELDAKSITNAKGNGLGRICNICSASQLKPCDCENNSWILPAINKNNHPTVKPTALMMYLIKLITPINGTVLDPFNGSGSTGKAAMLCKTYNYIGIDLNAEYITISQARIQAALSDTDTDTHKDKDIKQIDTDTQFFIE